MVPRAIANIFNDITNKPEQSFEIRVSYMEIYNERLFDLLADPASANPDDLHIQEDAKGVQNSLFGSFRNLNLRFCIGFVQRLRI